MLPLTITLADGGNVIFILLAVAWAVYSYYRKTQKAKELNRPVEDEPMYQEASPQPVPVVKDRQEEVQGKGLRELMEEIILGGEFTEKPVHADPPSPRKIRKPVEPEPFLQEELRLYKGGEYLPENERVQAMAEPVEEEIAFKGEINLEEFDLRKAVLLSEVLRRPYA